MDEAMGTVVKTESYMTKMGGKIYFLTLSTEQGQLRLKTFEFTDLRPRGTTVRVLFYKDKMGDPRISKIYDIVPTANQATNQEKANQEIAKEVNHEIEKVISGNNEKLSQKDLIILKQVALKAAVELLKDRMSPHQAVLEIADIFYEYLQKI